MKLKVSECINLSTALRETVKIQDLSSNLKYAVARNLKRLDPIMADFSESEKIRLDTYCKKNENGEYATIPFIDPNGSPGQKYDFGDQAKEAGDKYKELIEVEVEFEPYKVKRSEDTDRLPVYFQVELLDIIIIDETIEEPK